MIENSHFIPVREMAQKTMLETYKGDVKRNASYTQVWHYGWLEKKYLYEDDITAPIEI